MLKNRRYKFPSSSGVADSAFRPTVISVAVTQRILPVKTITMTDYVTSRLPLAATQEDFLAANEDYFDPNSDRR